METLLEYCKNYILDHIDDYKGGLYYACELAGTLTEGPNVDGSLTYSRAAAKEYLDEWSDDCARYLDYEKRNFGENYNNPFDNPEAYMVCMVLTGVETILARCPVIEEHWNDCLELTPKVIKQIKKFVEQYDNENLF